jgi:hypothetical protein
MEPPVPDDPLVRSLADPIAERRLELPLPGAAAAVVVAQLGRPVADRPGGGGPWACGVRVTSPGHVLERRAVGADGFDALRVALQMVRQELLADLPRLHGVALTWGGRAAAEALPDQFPPA